jgi:drug/metabolite transporter (DMT)-like permease
MGIMLFGEKFTLPVAAGTILILSSVVILAKGAQSKD